MIIMIIIIRCKLYIRLLCCGDRYIVGDGKEKNYEDQVFKVINPRSITINTYVTIYPWIDG